MQCSRVTYSWKFVWRRNNSENTASYVGYIQSKLNFHENAYRFIRFGFIKLV